MTIFAVAVPVNLLWEMAQTPLYAGARDFSRMLLSCFIASLGDGLLVLLIFAAGWVAFRRRDWFVRPGVRGYLLMLAFGLIVGVAIERTATEVAGLWEYTTRMPRVLGIGLAPVAQMLVLPPVIFRVVSAWCRHRATA